MKKKALFSTVLFLFFLSSCTIQKRSYMPGYYTTSRFSRAPHLENKKKSFVEIPERSKIKTIEVVSETQTGQMIASTDPSVVYSRCTKKSAVLKPFKGNKAERIYLRKRAPDDYAVPPVQKLQPSAITSFVFGLLSVLSFIFGFALLLSINSLYLIILAFFAILLFILGVIFAIVATTVGERAILKIKDDPEKWKGKNLAIAGMVLGGIVIAFVLLTILLSLLSR